MLSWPDTAIALQHSQSTGFGSQGCSVRPGSHPRPMCRSGARRPRQGVIRSCHVAENELDARLPHAADALDEPERTRTSMRKRCARYRHVREARAAACCPSPSRYSASESVPRAPVPRLRRWIFHRDLSFPTAGTHTPASSSTATASTPVASHATSTSAAAFSARAPQILPRAVLFQAHDSNVWALMRPDIPPTRTSPRLRLKRSHNSLLGTRASRRRCLHLCVRVPSRPRQARTMRQTATKMMMTLACRAWLWAFAGLIGGAQGGVGPGTDDVVPGFGRGAGSADGSGGNEVPWVWSGRSCL